MFIQALTSRMLTNLARLKDHVHCILFRLKSYVSVESNDLTHQIEHFQLLRSFVSITHVYIELRNILTETFGSNASRVGVLRVN